MSNPKHSFPKPAKKRKALDFESKPEFEPAPKRATIKIKHHQPQPTPVGSSGLRIIKKGG